MKDLAHLALSILEEGALIDQVLSISPPHLLDAYLRFTLTLMRQSALTATLTHLEDLNETIDEWERATTNEKIDLEQQIGKVMEQLKVRDHNDVPVLIDLLSSQVHQAEQETDQAKKIYEELLI